MSDTFVSVKTMDEIGHINLRGASGQPAFIEAVESELGQALPVMPNTTTEGSSRVFWLGPDEWQIQCAAASTADLLARLSYALSGQHSAVNDLSGGLTVFRLSGGNARNLLAKACTLDLHPDVFTAGSCAQSGLAKATALFVCTDNSDTFEIAVRRSFSDYLLRWLKRAGAEFGIEFR